MPRSAPAAGCGGPIAAAEELPAGSDGEGLARAVAAGVRIDTVEEVVVEHRGHAGNTRLDGEAMIRDGFERLRRSGRPGTRTRT